MTCVLDASALLALFHGGTWRRMGELTGNACRNHALPATGSGEHCIALRARLKEQDPPLFQHFLSALAT